MKEITLEADIKNIPVVTEFVDGILEEHDCSMKAQIQIDVAIDELFRKKALENGFILDSMKHDFSPMFSLDRSFIVRKIK